MKTRREFLQKVTTAALALPVASAYAIENSPVIIEAPYQGPILRVAIMGLGSYANRVA